MESKNQVYDSKKICGAKTRSGTPCQLRAGWGTNHVGEGRCKLHGGASTGPKNQKRNKNAVKTGEHETIWYDTLTDKEKNIFHRIRLDVANQIDDEIKLMDIRIRRMMKRIANLTGQSFTAVKRTEKQGQSAKGPVDMTEIESEGTLGQIQNIEEALTRVQGKKARLIKLKHQVETNQGPINVDVSPYLEALGYAAKDVWNDEEEEE